MGDYCDFITKNDKRYDTSGLAPWVKKEDVVDSQRKWVVDVLKPIASKCVGLLEGNHCVSIRLAHQDDVYSHICEDLGVTPLGYSCFLDLIFNRKGAQGTTQFRGRLTHGAGCPQTDGAIANRLKKALRDFEADFYATGHHHVIKADSSSPILTVNRSGRIISKIRCAAVTGCWFKTFEQGQRASYGERFDYSPTPIGCPVFIFEPDKGIVDVMGGMRERQA